MVLFGIGCEELSTDTNEEEKVLLLAGVWEVSSGTEVGELGVQLKFHEDGTAKVRESATSEWYSDVLTWSFSEDGKELSITGTNGPGTFDKLEVLELTETTFEGRIIESTSPDAIDKLFIMHLTQDEENPPSANEEEVGYLIDGVWQVAADSESSEVGVQIQFFQGGTARVRETASSEWYPDVLTWTLTNDAGELTITGTNGPGTFDKLEVLELTNSSFLGRIIDSSNSEEINKTFKLFKV